MNRLASMKLEKLRRRRGRKGVWWNTRRPDADEATMFELERRRREEIARRWADHMKEHPNRPFPIWRK